MRLRHCVLVFGEFPWLILSVALWLALSNSKRTEAAVCIVLFHPWELHTHKSSYNTSRPPLEEALTHLLESEQSPATQMKFPDSNSPVNHHTQKVILDCPPFSWPMDWTQKHGETQQRSLGESGWIEPLRWANPQMWVKQNGSYLTF